MGRPPKSRDHITEGRQHCDLDVRKTKHRYADTKYRSKVQFLYGKVKKLVNVESTKDGLLNDALKYILNKESNLCKIIGSENMKICKKDFVRFLMHEEAMWKQEKDLNKWWSKVEDTLNENYTFQGPIPKEADFIGMCADYDVESLNEPADINLYMENPNKAPSFEAGCKGHEGNPNGKISSYGSFSHNEVAESNSSEESLMDAVYTPNSFRSPTECSNYLPDVHKGNFIPPRETANKCLPPKDNEIYSVENPLVMSNSHISVDDSVFDNSAFSSATFLYL